MTTMSASTLPVRGIGMGMGSEYHSRKLNLYLRHRAELIDYATPIMGAGCWRRTSSRMRGPPRAA